MGLGTAGRHRIDDIAGRCEAYNHLNMKLLGALQLEAPASGESLGNANES